jgi:hypothetical protein
MTDLESCAHRLAASACSASADFSKCYWQLALDEDSQEGQSFVAPDGVYPPRRVLHGQVGATGSAQAAVRIMFQGLADKLLSWLDGLLLHCRDVDGLHGVQETFLNIYGPPACSSLAPPEWTIARKMSGGADAWYPGTESGSTRALCLPWRPCSRR